MWSRPGGCSGLRDVVAAKIPQPRGLNPSCFSLGRPLPSGGRPTSSQCAHRGGTLSLVSVPLLVRTPALPSRGRPPDFTAPSPNTVSWGLELHWLSPRHLGTGPGPTGRAAMLFCPGGESWWGGPGLLLPSLPRCHPRLCQPNPPTPGAALCPAQPPSCSSAGLGGAPGPRGGRGTGRGFPPAAGDPECVHPQQDCSSGPQSQCGGGWHLLSSGL